MNPLKLVVAITSLLAVVLSAEAGANERAIKFDKTKEAIFIFGFHSNYDKYSVFFFPIKSLTDTTYKATLFTPARFGGSPTDGYIIGTAKAGESIGLLSVDIGFSEPSLSNYILQFDICKRTPTVSLKPGEVVYFGDVEIVFDPITRKIALDTSNDVGAVTTYLSSSHPELSPLMKTRDLVLRDRVNYCSTPKK